jgi:hypothetical protein
MDKLYTLQDRIFISIVIDPCLKISVYLSFKLEISWQETIWAGKHRKEDDKY